MAGWPVVPVAIVICLLVIAALSGEAYTKLRELNGQYHYGNNYLLTILLENFDAIADLSAVEKAFADLAAEYGTPAG